MSRTCDTPILEQSINSRDRLLRLAELGSTNNKNKQKSSKHFKRNQNTSTENINSPNLDLSYTDNIEHLVNNNNNRKGISNANLEVDNDCSQSTSKHIDDIKHNSDAKISYRDSSQETLIHPNTTISVLNSHRNSCSKFLTETTETCDQNKQLISPPGNGQHSKNHPCLDLYSKYYEFRQNLQFSSNETKPSLLRMHSNHSKSSLISTVTLKSDNVKFIPIYNKKMVANQKTISQEKINTSQCLQQQQLNKDILLEMTSRKVHDRESSCKNESEAGSLPFEMNNNPVKRLNEINTDQDKMLSHFFDRINTFIMDEDNYTNSPKKILTKEVLFPKNNLFNCDTPQTTEYTLLLSNHDLLENLFLADSQKNSVFSISNNGSLKKKSSGTANKSSSCDNLDDIKSKSIDKFKSENDLTIQKNDLSGLCHLEEEIMEHDSVINRFRKKFSIHGRSAGNSPKYDNPNNNNNTFYFNKLNGGKVIENSSNQRNSEKIEINQNKIDLKNVENFKYFLSNGKLSPRETRKLINRKSLRKMSRKHSRLKRSHTQPFDQQIDEFHEEMENNNKFIDLMIPNHEDQGISTSNSPSNDIVDDSHHNNVIYAEAIFDYLGSDIEELSFRAGDLIEVTDTSHKQWWWGAIKVSLNDETRYGWFPATYVRLKVSQEETILESLENVDRLDMVNPQMRTSISKLSSEQVRANVVLEIINTEKDFVKNLKDVIDGYLKPCRDRKDMFDETRISTIFGNIEELYEFQSKFLSQLEECIDGTNLSQSRIGKCFLENEKGFSVYSEFCKNHPLATSELQDLYTDHKYIIFFEGCRLLQNMIDISLDGFLLTPIQKICKYPLQLAELLKYTKPDHCDYAPVSDAHKCMQRVAQMVNERKSRFESLEKLLSIQESFENWEGSSLLDTCSLLIHSGEIIRVTRTSWSKEHTLFLFDHLLILAKKDTRILKKRTYLFKTRINLDHIDSIISLDDNVKDSNFNVLTKNAFKFYYKLKQKWYLFQAKSLEDKELWIKAFEEERQRIKEDEKQGFVVTEQDKKGAQLAHQNNLKPKKPKARKPYTKIKKPDTVIAEIPLGPLKGFEIDRNRAGSLPSYIHQEKHMIDLYKNRQSTMHKKSCRSNWFQLGSSINKKSRVKRNLK